MKQGDYRLANTVSSHCAVHADEDESLFAIVDDEGTREHPKVDTCSFLFAQSIAQLKVKQ